jgi:DEAD/DEAH box helicase domain-containing protein
VTTLDLASPTATIDRVGGWIGTIAADPRVVHIEVLSAQRARLGRLGRQLPPELTPLLPPGGLWTHQAEAIDLIRRRHSVVLATPTASGKSLAYQIPVVEAALDRLRSGTSLLLYPTKALARDQLHALTTPVVPALVAAAYDGDCSPEERSWVREHATVILTNPEMVHHGLLPNHRRWARWLSRLRYVVVDETHVLRGIFGSHVAHVLRRLVRIAHHYGADPTFVFCSATVGEPGRLAEELCGRPVCEITASGAPSGRRHVVLWDPTQGPGDRPSLSADTVEVATSLIGAGLRTLVFCRSRRSTELVAAALRQRTGAGDRVRAYRAGYLPAERREIEAALLEGDLDGVVATTALELGIDIGGLDAVVLSGFPGTTASMWQQIGRAGRGPDPSVAVLVAGEDQLDRWVMDHPTEALRRPPERAVINPANPWVLDAQIACAAHELPLSRVDEGRWGDLLDEAIVRGVRGDWLEVRRPPAGDPRAVWTGLGWPSSGIGLRSSGTRELRIVDDRGELIGTMDHSRAHEQAHPGAVYLHQGRAWRVTELDESSGLVHVRPDDGGTSTTASSTTEMQLVRSDAARMVGRAEVSRGEVVVTRQVVGYVEREVEGHRVLDRVELDLPPRHLNTRAVWITVPPQVCVEAGIPMGSIGPALHAIEHTAIGILPLFAICDRWDVGGVSTEWWHDVAAPAIVIYDGYQGGAGVAELAWEVADRHLAATLGILERCRCAAGCPSCVQSPKCGNANDALDKAAALSLLRTLLHR